MNEQQVIIGVVAAVIGIVGYITYYRAILIGHTKPHPFSWLGFALLTGITFFAQIASGGGPGAWVTGISAIATAGIAVLALAKGERQIVFFDWVCFAGALLGVVAWQLTNNPLTAVVIVVTVDIAAFVPTYRKAYLRPREESLTNYALTALKYAVSLCALTSINLTTILVPISVIVSNVAFVLMVWIRKRRNNE